MGAASHQEMAAAVAVSGAKRSLRAKLKQRLRALSAEERLRQSHLLAQKVFTHSECQKSKRVSIFLSMPDEIETEEIIKDIFRQGKTCFIPRYQLQSNHIDMVKLASPEEIASLPRTSWNIQQPSEDEVLEEALSTGGLDLIFVPGLGFDKQSNRLGWGKGYYVSLPEALSAVPGRETLHPGLGFQRADLPPGPGG